MAILQLINGKCICVSMKNVQFLFETGNFKWNCSHTKPNVFKSLFNIYMLAMNQSRILFTLISCILLVVYFMNSFWKGLLKTCDKLALIFWILQFFFFLLGEIPKVWNLMDVVKAFTIRLGHLEAFIYP